MEEENVIHINDRYNYGCYYFYEKTKQCDYNNINYVDIANYNKQYYNMSARANLKDYMIILNEQASKNNNCKLIHDNKNMSLFEYLSGDYVRMFFDIHKIPKNDVNMIYQIIKDIYDVFKINFVYDTFKINKDPDMDYTLTYNINSSDNTLSYHLFLPFKTTIKDMHNFVRLFNYQTNYKYINYINPDVYKKFSIFRTLEVHILDIVLIIKKYQEIIKIVMNYYMVN